jgi:hypothetical protein
MTECSIVLKNEEKRMVWGWASVIKRDGKVVVDHQGDIIEPEELAKAAYGYVSEERTGMAMHGMTRHFEKRKVAELVESMVVTESSGFPALMKAMGAEPPSPLPVEGWWVGFRILDDDAWDLVKRGVLKAFSIGGSGTRVEV